MRSIGRLVVLVSTLALACATPPPTRSADTTPSSSSGAISFAAPAPSPPGAATGGAPGATPGAPTGGATGAPTGGATAAPPSGTSGGAPGAPTGGAPGAPTGGTTGAPTGGTTGAPTGGTPGEAPAPGGAGESPPSGPGTGETTPSGPGASGPSPNGPGTGAASPSSPGVGGQAPGETPIGPPSNAALPELGVPASISFEIVGGTAQDAVHAMYKKGSSLKLRAIIRDGYGNIISPTKDHPCTPEFSLEGAGTPSGGTTATLTSGDVVNFNEPGMFTVSVACREHPEINSHSNTAPYNFETNDTSPFTHEAHVAKPAGGIPVAAVLLLAAAGVALAYVIVDAGSSSSPADCGCVCAYGGNDCSNGGTAFCTAHWGFAVGCASSTGNCDCTNGATARVATPHTVEQLVARGLAQRPVPAPRMVAAHGATTLRDAQGRTPGATTASTSHLGAWIGGTLAAASVATTAYLLWTHAHPHRIDIAPYVAPEGGGITVLGRF